MNKSLQTGYNGSVLSIKYLFRITILLAATFVVVLLSSCQGERGPMGPTGPMGNQGNGDGYTEFKTIEFTVKPSDWTLQVELNKANKWFFKYNIPAITAEVEEKGMVLIYMKSANKQTWQLMPYTFMDRDANNNYYSTEYTSWWGVGQIELQYTDTHQTPLAPDFNVSYKVVVARDVYPSVLLVKDDVFKVINTLDNLTDLDRENQKK